MKNIKFSRDEKRKIVNYIQKVLNIKILSPRDHNTKECDEDIKKIFQECYKKDPHTYYPGIEKSYKVTENKKIEELERIVEQKNVDNNILKEEILKLTKENEKLRKKLKHKKFLIF